MTTCGYCGKKFIPAIGHKWGDCCSKDCRYGVDLPLSHGGNSFVSFDLIESENIEKRMVHDALIPDAEAVKHETQFPAEMLGFLRDWLRLTPLQRDTVAKVLIHPGVKLRDIHGLTGETCSFQAMHRRLMSACQKMPALKCVIRRYKVSARNSRN